MMPFSMLVHGDYCKILLKVRRIVVALLVVETDNGGTFAPTSQPNEPIIIDPIPRGQTISAGVWALMIGASILAILLILLGIWCLRRHRDKQLSSGYSSVRDRGGEFDARTATTDEDTDADVPLDGASETTFLFTEQQSDQNEDNAEADANSENEEPVPSDVPFAKFMSKSQIEHAIRLQKETPGGPDEVVVTEDENEDVHTSVAGHDTDNVMDEDDQEDETVVVDIPFEENKAMKNVNGDINVSEIVHDLNQNQALHTDVIEANKGEVASDAKEEYKIGFIEAN